MAREKTAAKPPNAGFGVPANDTLKLERDIGAEDNKAFLEQQINLELQIESLQEQMRLDCHRFNLKEQVVALRREVYNESGQRFIRIPEDLSLVTIPPSSTEGESAISQDGIPASAGSE
ncbi:hypothetical protein B0H14DRAFT_2558690 [Mycena olivaceomarginata]|nr:hypothetical protein B0H14DRAFT_2558690 [Mycena olivaceomarginata]